MKFNPFKKKLTPIEELAGLSPKVLAVVQKLIDESYALGYNDGKQAGVEISKQAAIKSLKEAIWHQNQHEQKK